MAILSLRQLLINKNNFVKFDRKLEKKVPYDILLVVD